MYPRVKNWSYNKLVKPHEVAKVVEVVNPEIVSIESNNDGKLIRPDGSNNKITVKKPVKKLEGKGKKKKKVNFKKEESDEESDYEEPEEPRKRPAQRLLETIKNEKKDEHINSSKTKGIKKPKKQMSDEDKKKIAELMKRLRS